MSMVRSILLFAFVFLININISAQIDTTELAQEWDIDSSIDTRMHRKYFVCESRDLFRQSKIIENGEKIVVWDTLGRRISGTIHIINSEKFTINTKYDISDTLLISNMYLVKYATKARKAWAGVLLTMGWSGIISGIAIAAFPPAYISDPSIYLFSGILLATFSLPIEIAGMRLANGHKYKRKHYRFRIIQTKGFELKKKHIHQI